MDVNVAEDPQNTNQNVYNKATHDPGWNDPPLMSYDDTRLSSTSAKKSILNKPKRIAFPLGPNSPTLETKGSSDLLLDSSVSTPPRNIPPRTGAAGGSISSSRTPPSSSPQGLNICTPPSLSPISLFTPPSNSPLNIYSPSKLPDHGETAKSVVLPAITDTSLGDVMKVLEDSTLKALQGVDLEKDAAEIRKRLIAMKKMWEEDKLDLIVQQRMLQLTEALKGNEASTANEIIVALSVDHTSQCRTWMAGVRKLVHHIVTTANQTANHEEEDVVVE